MEDNDQNQDQLRNSSPCGSNLSDKLQRKLKIGLKPTKTKVTKSDGTVMMLENQGNVLVETCEKTFGFVVDLKPDLSVGIVKPWLLISSQDVPNDLVLITNHKITHILSLIPDFVLQPSIKNIVDHLCISVYDEGSFSLSSPEISQGLNFINKVDKSVADKNGCILVHCNAGISRAPSVVILYLMVFEGLHFDEAYNVVLQARPTIKPNEGFLRQLKSLKG